MTFDLKKYWDGQPVRYHLMDNTTKQDFLVVQFNIQDLDK